MARFRVSRRAEADLYNIGLYTLRIWGEAQAERYLRELEDCCQQLADSPRRGRACDEIRPRLWRMEQGRHVIFYREDPSCGILISRILHHRMLPEKQAIDADETKPD